MVKKTGSFIFFLAMAAACLEEPECFSLNNNYIGIAFKKMSTNGADTVTFSSITADSDRPDTLFSIPLVAISRIARLPLNYFRDSTVFYLEGADTTYELHLHYTAQAQFVSEDCGERFVLSGLRVGKGTNFDSVRVVSAVPMGGLATGTHLEIYSCPDPSQVKITFSAEVSIKAIELDYEATVAPPEDPVTSIIVPLNKAAETTSINFIFSDDTSSTLNLAYTAQQSTLFHACGAQTVLSNLSFDAQTTTFDSVQVVRTNFQDPPQTNIAITF